MKKNRGITLISLVVTIIILIILAGIGLNLVLGEGGILQKAREGKEKQKVASIQDKLELEKGDLDIKEQGELDLDKYLAQIQEKGIITEEDIVRNHEESVDVIVEDKYVFLVEKEESGNIKIEYLGEPSDLTPRIEIKNVSNTSHSVTIEFEIRYASKYKVSIRDEEQEIKGQVEEKVNSRTISHTFENLEQSQNYMIKIEAETEKGVKAEKEQNVSTKTVLGLTEANCTFSYSPDDWTNKTVTATANVTVDITGYTLQTSQDGLKWEDTKSQTLEENGPVYARLIDITEQEGGSTTGNVEKIDKQKPIVTEETKATTNTITIKATDDASGIIGYTVTEDNTEPKSFKECESTQSLSINVGDKKQGTIYYVWVKDDADNISVYKEIKTDKVTALTNSNCTFSYSPDDWTNQSVTATAVTDVPAGYTLQTSQDGEHWDNTPSQTLSENGPVYARLIDSTRQEGGSTTGNVDKIDKQKPEVTNETKATTNTITIKATDDASGIIGYTVTENKTEPKDFIECTSRKELTIDVGSKTQGKTYYVWVKDDADNISVYKEIKTGTVSTPNITIAKENDWTSSGKSVTLSKVDGYTTKYTTDGSAPSATHGTTYSSAFTISANNTTVKAVYVDSTNQVGGIASKTVSKIDLANPTEATITISGSTTQNSLPVTLTAKVTHNDGESGVKIESCKYKLNTSNAELGTETSKYDTTFSNNGQSITIKPDSATSWYLHVLTVDKVGHAKETIKGPIKITENKHKHTGSKSAYGGCYTKTTTHTHDSRCYCPNTTLDSVHWWNEATGENSRYGYECSVCSFWTWIAVTWDRPNTFGITHYKTNCGYTVDYALNCGKDESTVDSYSITY